MITQRVNRTDAEKVLIIVDNGEGATLPAQANVVWETGTDANGLLVQQPDAATEHLYAGVMDASMASVTGTYTLCQVYGYRSSSIVFQTDTSQAAGLPLIVSAGANHLQSAVTTTASNTTITQHHFYAALAASVASSSASATISVGVYIRAM